MKTSGIFDYENTAHFCVGLAFCCLSYSSNEDFYANYPLRYIHFLFVNVCLTRNCLISEKFL